MGYSYGGGGGKVPKRVGVLTMWKTLNLLLNFQPHNTASSFNDRWDRRPEGILLAGR